MPIVGDGGGGSEGLIALLRFYAYRKSTETESFNFKVLS
jgi:hypothetical protein